MNARTLAAAVLVVVLGAACWFFASGHVEEPVAPPPAVRTDPAAPSPLAPLPPRERSPAAAEPTAADERVVVVRVVEKETKSPIVAATVALIADDLVPREATTDASGVARVSGPAGADGERLLVRAAGFSSQFAYANSNDVDVTVEMARGIAVAGVVLETDGRPIAGARVVHRRGGEDEDCLAESYPPLAEATTGADGAFRLEGLRSDRPAGISVSASRHVAKSARWDPAAPVRVEIRLDRAGRITGVVLDPTLAPAAGASVYAYQSESIDPVGAPIDEDVTSDASGRYEIDGIPFVGAWTIVASKAGFAYALRGEVVVDAAHQEVSCDLLLRPLARIEVVVVDAAGAPVEEGTVSYQTVGERAGVKLDADGRCVLELGDPGACRIQVETPRHPFFETDATCASGETTPLRIELAEGVTVAGVVVDDLGHAVPQAEVEVQGHVGRDGQWFDRATTSGDDGAFRVQGLGAQVYAVKASAAGHGEATVSDVVAPADGVRVVLRRHGRVTLRLRAPDGIPTSEDCMVTFTGRDAPHLRLTSGWTDGRVSTSLPSGRWFVAVHKSGHVRVQHPFEVSPGAETSIGEIVLQEGVGLNCVVRDAAGEPVTDAQVVVSRIDGAIVSSQRVDETGAISDRQLAGRYRVAVSRKKRELATREVELRDGEETNLEIVVPE